MNRATDGMNEGAAGILRAVGSLLVALSGGDEAAARRLLARAGAEIDEAPNRRGSRYNVPPPRRRSDPDDDPRYAPRRRTSASFEEAEFILADARERARRILDDAMEQADELLAPRGVQHYADESPVIDDLRRAMSDLVSEVRDIQQRLGRIETLLRDARADERRRSGDREQREASRPTSPAGSQYPYAPPASTAPPAPRPPSFDYQVRPGDPQTFEPPPRPEALAEPPASRPEPSPPEYTPPEHTWTAPSSPPAAPEPPPAMPAAPSIPTDPSFDDTLDAPPPSAVPPMRITAAAPAPSPASAFTSAPISGQSPSFEDGSTAPIATFLPSEGPVSLRISPVAGFQGLMRVQDALARLPAVRNASVEAYSQGEARLRIELAEATDSEEFAQGLSRSLKSPAHVVEVSEADRELLIALR